LAQNRAEAGWLVVQPVAVLGGWSVVEQVAAGLVWRLVDRLPESDWQPLKLPLPKRIFWLTSLLLLGFIGNRNRCVLLKGEWYFQRKSPPLANIRGMEKRETNNQLCVNLDKNATFSGKFLA
jgi:hypothetical protein